jgi:3,4-dihydroxy 2-butanone 4-phosphate synthase
MSAVDDVEKAIRDFKKGKPVLIYDWPTREGEVDMVYYAGLIDHRKIYKLRTKAGGLLCFATNENIAKSLGISLMSDLLERLGYKELSVKKASYGGKSPFSLWVNSVHVRTGISDIDRAMTISQLHKVTSLVVKGDTEQARKMFYSDFYAPGHVPILIAKDIGVRKGHTELAIALAILSGLEPSVVFAEMLDYGHSLSLEKAKKFAENHDLALITGKELLETITKVDS